MAPLCLLMDRSPGYKRTVSVNGWSSIESMNCRCKEVVQLMAEGRNGGICPANHTKYIANFSHIISFTFVLNIIANLPHQLHRGLMEQNRLDHVIAPL